MTDNLILPRLERTERDVMALHEQSRQQHARLEALSITRDQTETRVRLLEEAVRNQHAENARTHTDIEGLKLSVGAMREALDGVKVGQTEMFRRFSAMQTSVEQLVLTNVSRHAKLMRWVLWVGVVLATLLAFVSTVLAPGGHATLVSGLTELLTRFLK